MTDPSDAITHVPVAPLLPLNGAQVFAIVPTEDVVPVDIAEPERWKDKIPVFRVAPEVAVLTKS